MVDEVKVSDTEISFDDDFDLDSVEDLPGFVTPPSGAYVVTCDKGVEEKDIETQNGTKTFYTWNFKIDSVMEINEHSLESGEVPPKEGDMFSMMFTKSNQGVAFMKPLLVDVAQKFGVKNFKAIQEKTVGAQFLMVLKRRYVKKVDRYNINVVNAALT